MVCPRCARPLLTFRLNPERGRVEPFCAHCGLHIELPPAGSGPRCPGCGMDFAAARSLRLLGCETCYDTFADFLGPMLRSRQPAGYFFERQAPSSLALSRVRLIQEIYQREHMASQEDRRVAGPGPDVGASGEDGDVTGNRDASWPLPDPTLAGGISLRIRLMRNVPGLPYPGRMEEGERGRLRSWMLGSGASVRLVVGEILQRLRMVHGPLQETGAALASDGIGGPTVRLWTGDEDHLRLSFTWRLAPPAAAEPGSKTGLADLIDRRTEEFRCFENALDAAFFWQARPFAGFLAACPSNTGSGRRVSLQFSTEGLEKRDARLWLRCVEETRRSGFEIRGRRGERSAPDGVVTVLLPDEFPGREPDRDERVRRIHRGLALYDRIRGACRY